MAGLWKFAALWKEIAANARSFCTGILCNCEGPNCPALCQFAQLAANGWNEPGANPSNFFCARLQKFLFGAATEICTKPQQEERPFMQGAAKITGSMTKPRTKPLFAASHYLAARDEQ